MFPEAAPGTFILPDWAAVLGSQCGVTSALGDQSSLCSRAIVRQRHSNEMAVDNHRRQFFLNRERTLSIRLMRFTRPSPMFQFNVRKGPFVILRGSKKPLGCGQSYHEHTKQT